MQSITDEKDRMVWDGHEGNPRVPKYKRGKW